MPDAAMYIWAKIPDRVNEYYSQQSMKFCIDLMEATGVIVSPGIGFGEAGEGYVRFALVHEVKVLKIAIDRIGQFLDKINLSFQR
jgi:aspartate/methionine/tyrosine aminotransferase